MPRPALQVDELQRSLAFVSISTDGEVLLWSLAKCELLPERLMRLQPAAAAAGAAASTAGAAAAVPSSAAAAAGGSSSSGGGGTGGCAGVAASEALPPAQQIEGGLCMDFGKVRC
jgi:hypothetical protein